MVSRPAWVRVGKSWLCLAWSKEEILSCFFYCREGPSLRHPLAPLQMLFFTVTKGYSLAFWHCRQASAIDVLKFKHCTVISRPRSQFLNILDAFPSLVIHRILAVHYIRGINLSDAIIIPTRNTSCEVVLIYSTLKVIFYSIVASC